MNKKIERDEQEEKKSRILFSFVRKMKTNKEGKKENAKQNNICDNRVITM